MKEIFMYFHEGTRFFEVCLLRKYHLLSGWYIMSCTHGPTLTSLDLRPSYQHLCVQPRTSHFLYRYRAWHFLRLSSLFCVYHVRCRDGRGKVVTKLYWRTHPSAAAAGEPCACGPQARFAVQYGWRRSSHRYEASSRSSTGRTGHWRPDLILGK